MPVVSTSKKAYFEERAKLEGDTYVLLGWLERNDRPEGWTFCEMNRGTLGWYPSRISARINPLVRPKDPNAPALVVRPKRRNCLVTGRLAYAHRAACADPQARMF